MRLDELRAPEILFEKLTAECAEAGFKLTDHGNGHWQISGGNYLVNVYAIAKRPSIYIAGTKGKIPLYSTAPNAIVQFARTGAIRVTKTERKKPKVYRAWKRKKFAKHPFCHWCKTGFEKVQDATLDHVIPLSKGGLDHPNNIVLAHEKCNGEKGNKMPHEITSER